jgi:hypothetical protein
MKGRRIFVLQITAKNRKERIGWQHRVLGWLNLLDWPNVRVVTMLAEIFMVRLEAAARASEEKAALRNSRFVTFADRSQFVFKDSREQVVEPLREKAPAQHTQAEE